ncbi:hypothetical protein ACFSHQ_24350 [Gemmobacter lanyuensis]
MQLCAQALCLEEMTGQPVPEGALYYAETHRRVTVPFDADLRSLTEATVAALAQVFATLQTPPQPRTNPAAGAVPCMNSAARKPLPARSRLGAIACFPNLWADHEKASEHRLCHHRRRRAEERRRKPGG